MPDADNAIQILSAVAADGGTLTLLALCTLVLFAFALCALALTIRNQHRLLNANLQRMEDLNNEVSSYGQSLIAMRTLLTGMERRISEFTDRNLEIQSQFAFNRSFEEASRLVRDGGTMESLITDCGLSDSEAALMVRLHGSTGQKPRRQWKQVPTGPADTIEEAVTSEEIRLRETMSAYSRKSVS